MNVSRVAIGLLSVSVPTGTLKLRPRHSGHFINLAARGSSADARTAMSATICARLFQANLNNIFLPRCGVIEFFDQIDVGTTDATNCPIQHLQVRDGSRSVGFTHESSIYKEAWSLSRIRQNAFVQPLPRILHDFQVRDGLATLPRCRSTPRKQTFGASARPQRATDVH
jgi:hypothetical protein